MYESQRNLVLKLVSIWGVTSMGTGEVTISADSSMDISDAGGLGRDFLGCERFKLVLKSNRLTKGSR